MRLRRPHLRRPHLRRPRLRAALRPPGRTVRSRLTWIYGSLFLLSGAVLLTVTGVLWGHATDGTITTFSNAPVRILNVTGLAATAKGGSGAQVAGGAVPVASGGASGGSGAAASTARVASGTSGAAASTARVASGTSGASGAPAGGLVEAAGSAPPPGAGPVTGSPVRQNAAKRQFVVGQLRVLADEQHSSDLHDLLLYSALALGIMAVLAIVLGWLMAGRVLRPLRTITATARDISANNLHERLEMDGPDDELKELGDTFDQLLGRLERSFQTQQQFVANASHELRTPLATMRATLDVALAKPDPAPPQTVLIARRLRRELDHVDRLLGGFLALARAQAGATAGDVPLSLDRLVASSLDDRAGPIADLDLTVDRCGCPDARVAGNRPLLARMVENLVDNAVRHNRPGGWVHVRSQVDARTARLVVENDGPVLDESALQELGQPFRRLRADRTGSDTGLGLGLSIVAAIADAHGGHLALHALRGGGFQAVVDLPLATAVAGGSEGGGAGGGAVAGEGGEGGRTKAGTTERGLAGAGARA
jgi:signal transduction histidine kinase